MLLTSTRGQSSSRCGTLKAKLDFLLLILSRGFSSITAFLALTPSSDYPVSTTLLPPLGTGTEHSFIFIACVLEYATTYLAALYASFSMAPKFKDGDAVVAFSGKWVSWAHTAVAYAAFLGALFTGLYLHYYKIVENQYYVRSPRPNSPCKTSD